MPRTRKLTLAYFNSLSHSAGDATPIGGREVSNSLSRVRERGIHFKIGFVIGSVRADSGYVIKQRQKGQVWQLSRRCTTDVGSNKLYNNDKIAKNC